VRGRRAADAKLEAGKAALARGDWRAAREDFTQALEGRESASALEGLSEALWWLDEVPESLRLREQAFRLWEQKEQWQRAARAAVWLAREHAAALGDSTAAAAWLERAEGLASRGGPGGAAGWLELTRARLAPDGATAAALAERAREEGRAHADRDLELSAQAEQGRALVIMGRVDDGMALLDEAVAAVSAGEARSVQAAGEVYRSMILACDRALDLARATQWCRVVDEFARQHHFVPLFAACQDVYGGLLVATGRWAAAESALARAARTLEKGHPALRAGPLARLAQLRVRQGRPQDAAQLLDGIEEHPAAAAAVAELCLARGDAERAVAVLERRLETAAQDATLAAPLLEALLEARLALGDREGARGAAGRLDTLATETDRPVIEAAAVLAAARVRDEGAPLPETQVEQALELYAAAGLPFEAARARLQWARATAALRPDGAAADARRALEVFQQLGAELWAAAASELLSGRPRAARRTPR
jgi:hypothetical protein